MTKFLLTIHVLASIILIGPVTVAASLFPRYARQALADGADKGSAEVSVRLLHRISKVYALVSLSVPVFGIATAQAMGVMGSGWLVASMALTAVAAVLLGIAVLGTQDAVVTVLDTPDSEPATVKSVAAKLPQLSMITGLFALSWLIVVVLMIVRPGSTTGA